MTDMAIHPDDLAEQKRIIRTVHVDARPAPGMPATAPEPEAEPAEVDHSAGMAGARHALDEPPAQRAAHPAGCRCSAWCRDDWEYFVLPIGPCSGCGEPCRSTDPEGRLLHPTCEVAA